jgi:acyl-CoA thioesterase
VPTTDLPRFERDTAVTRQAEDAFSARVDPDWWVLRGPNGGYLAAIALRALTVRVGDPHRAARSLTVHFVAPPVEGDLAVHTAVERVGGSLTSCSARVIQDGRLVALALAAFSAPRTGPAFTDLAPPAFPPAETLPTAPPPDFAPAFAHRWEARWALGRRPSPDEPPAAEAAAGGWIRPEEPQLLDAPAIVAITDAWIPAIITRHAEPLAVPTIDLTVHLRAGLPHPGLAPDGFVMAQFRTGAAADGFFEEDGEIWAPDGTLLAQSRQLAAILPLNR